MPGTGIAPPPTRREVERKLSLRSAASDTPASSLPIHPVNVITQSNPISSLPLPVAPFAAPPPGSPSIGGTDPFTASATAGTASAAGMSDEDLPDIGEEEEEFSDAEMMAGGDDVEFSEDERNQAYAQASGQTPSEGGQYHQVLPTSVRAVGSQPQVASRVDDELKRRMEGERLIKSGYLLKKGERRKTWKKRWFVLRTEKLAYYKDQKEYVLCRILNLRDIHSVLAVQLKKNQHHTIGIVTPQRTYYVRASSGAEMEGWIRALNETRRALAESDELVEREGERKRAKSGNDVSAQPVQQSTAAPMPFPTNTSQDGNNNPPFRQATLSESLSGLSLSTSPRSAAPIVIPSGQIPTTGHLFPSYTSSSTIFSQSPFDTSPVDMRKLSVGSSTGGAVSDTSQHGAPVPRRASVPLGDGVRKQPSNGSLSSSRVAPVQLAAATSSGTGLSTSFKPGNGFEEYGMVPVVTGTSLGVVSGAAVGGGLVTSSDSEEDMYPSAKAAQFARTIDFDSHSTQQPQQQQYTSTASSNATSPTVLLPHSTLDASSLAASPSMYTAPAMPVRPVQTDPHKVILSGYLMKLGNKRKTWRKRWFVLTSGELVYTKSHMDSKVHRTIPLSCMLDALAFDALPAPDSADDSSSDDGNGDSFAGPTSPSNRSTPKGRANSNSSRTNRRFAGPPYAAGPNTSGLRAQQQERHTFQVITPKRTFKLCAPTEEEEIKWLAALRALINRERGAMSPGTSIGPFGVTGSSSHSNMSPYTQGSRQPLSPPAVGITRPSPQSISIAIPPVVSGTTSAASSMTANPHNQDMVSPTSPGLQPSGLTTMPLRTPVSGTASIEHSYFPPQVQESDAQQQQSASASASTAKPSGPSLPPLVTHQSHRNRSATQTAKAAVAEVVRRFHTEPSHAHPHHQQAQT
ncbi:hypothetical protein QFC22_000966 [Naganishia vaughanmartiniae]|uniref:Uncharacterized protein n=1 Tax=Naganishia vaughanmartiniae TaxID=1424756 RepID=A0ACC2XLC9_9TREE|nr:hypothetical protein QFC22_000966 [Naganishia vaughanmartiniae]